MSAKYESEDVDELLDLSRSNAQALVIATAAYFELTQQSSEDWARFLGEVFSGSWDMDTDLRANDFLEAMLTNYQSLGARIVDSNLSDQVATATIQGFPNEELCVELNCNCRLADVYFDVPLPLAARYDLDWSWIRAGHLVKLEVKTIAANQD
jgi:hypothetical protein